MGNDGGSIPHRSELVKTKQKGEQKDKACAKAALWNNCSLSEQLLQEPIVSDQLGKLFNKESILEFLLDKEKYASTNVGHIKNMKDVVQLKFRKNPELEDHPTAPKFICPMSGIEMDGTFRFVYLLNCGCVFAEKAIKQLNKFEACVECGKSATPADTIVLNCSGEELEKHREKMEERKKNKKKKKHKIEETVTSKVETKKPKVAEKVIEKQKPEKSGSKLKKSIQEDPEASSAYKSLFNTCEAAKKQKKAHWVTHNPMYY
ncbi:DgyrCDS5815 [Dimorphilus gyrociliatus]|uniref:Replication termination factor 2 n=1 Tax=Dimorphilus gyrociliatus TaxID=2664684 RepID=A0A7I8VL09_9ANNE|nr:DgyrCDS5815 [Dimorphilus gyrociliatus]